MQHTTFEHRHEFRCASYELIVGLNISQQRPSLSITVLLFKHTIKIISFYLLFIMFKRQYVKRSI